MNLGLIVRLFHPAAYLHSYISHSPMSLYFEAAKVLDEIRDKPASLKDRVYKDKTLKSSPGTVFALISEATKWSEVLSEVIDKSQVLSLERKVRIRLTFYPYKPPC